MSYPKARIRNQCQSQRLFIKSLFFFFFSSNGRHSVVGQQLNCSMLIIFPFREVIGTERHQNPCISSSSPFWIPYKLSLANGATYLFLDSNHLGKSSGGACELGLGIVFLVLCWDLMPGWFCVQFSPDRATVGWIFPETL